MRQVNRWMLAFALPVLACSPNDTVKPASSFIEAGEKSGFTFTHHNGMTGERYFSEIVGPGAALLDYDNDGDLDAYLVQGGDLGPGSAKLSGLSDRLLRNDSTEAQLRFVDVTEEAQIAATGYGMGVSTGDVNGDGWVDLYVGNFGPNQLLVNQGDGTFIDATTPILSEPRWTTSSAFLDYDQDGDLDLFAANYVEYRIAQHRPCLNAAGTVEYCGPASFPPEGDRLWRNRGDGTFEDVTGISGLVDTPGSGLGVVSADFNGDAWPDLYVANDLMPNYLYLNQGDGTFVEDALLAGCAVNENGAPEASMGLAVADFDRDGDDDIFMTHLDTETNTAFANDAGVFRDISNEWGLAVPSLGMTGFGTAPLDFDNDGWIDLVAANGAVKTIDAQRLAGDPLPLREPNMLLRNEELRFQRLDETGSALGELAISRGLARGDIDNDGDDDIVIMNNNGPARLLVNQVGQRAGWFGLRVPAGDLYRSLGATISSGNGSTTLRTAESYCSAADPRVRLGGFRGKSPVQIRWPAGEVVRLTAPPAKRYLNLPAPPREGP